MAKEKQASESYLITQKIFEQGYFGVIDGKTFLVTKGEIKFVPDGKTGNKVRKLVPGKVMENEAETDKKTFDDLTPLQVHELVQAGVVTLNGDQTLAYSKWQKDVLYKKSK